jgi:adenosylcobinamide-GDP ribazoletransferase
MRDRAFLGKIVRDIRIAVSLTTIYPVGPAMQIDDGEVARASWALPVAGLLVGLAGGAIYFIAHAASLTAGPAATLALAATVLLTGALHEDGLADTADGLGGGRTRDRKLDIMRDSRIGTYGACALFLSLMVRWSALMAIAGPRAVLITLCVAHAASRASLPTFMRLVPPARSDGLAAQAGRPPQQSAVIAILLGALCLVCGFGVAKTIVVLIVLSLAGLVMARIAIKQIGGQTGDILGTLQQIGEIVLMLLAATIF